MLLNGVHMFKIQDQQSVYSLFYHRSGIYVVVIFIFYQILLVKRRMQVSRGRPKGAHMVPWLSTFEWLVVGR